MRLVDVASVMHICVRLIDMLDKVSTPTYIAPHFRDSASRGDPKRLLVRISISVCWVGLSGYSRLLAVLVVRSTVSIVRNWGGGTGHSGVIRNAPIIVVVVMVVLLFGDQSSSTNSTKLCIFMCVGLILVVLLLPESFFTGAGGIVVGWAGAVTLVPLACTTENDLQTCRE